MDIRQAILDELGRRGWSNYRLAKEVQSHMSNVAVYEFLRGETEMTSSNLNHILAALGMTLQAPADAEGATRRAAKGKAKG